MQQLQDSSCCFGGEFEETPCWVLGYENAQLWGVFNLDKKY
jgi:hypothetical protein